MIVYKDSILSWDCDNMWVDGCGWMDGWMKRARGGRELRAHQSGKRWTPNALGQAASSSFGCPTARLCSAQAVARPGSGYCVPGEFSLWLCGGTLLACITGLLRRRSISPSESGNASPTIVDVGPFSSGGPSEFKLGRFLASSVAFLGGIGVQCTPFRASVAVGVGEVK